MPVQNPSRGYASSARMASHPSAYSEILATDFGAGNGGALAALSVGTSGNLATTTARVAITWITTEGESGPSVEVTAAVTGPNGDVVVTKPTTPSGGVTVLGWRVYSSSGAAGSALLNAAGTTQTQQGFVTNQGTLQGFPLTTTTVQVNTYGAGQAEPLVDFSGIQTSLPLVPAQTTVDYYFKIPNSGSRWKIQKSVEWMRPEGFAEPGGITVGPMDCLSPVYPGVSTVVTASIAAPVYFSVNGYLFVASTSGTTAATFIGFSAFNTTTFGKTTDGTVVWTCLGHQLLVRCHFGNSSVTAATPTAQEYDLFEA